MNHWLFSLACLSLCFPSPLQAADQPGPSEKTSASILPFRLSAGYLIQVEGRIGAQAHLKFILDTGATISIVSRRIAQNLQLKAGAAQSFNFGRTLRWDTATIPEVQFGPIRAENVAVLVGDLLRYSVFTGKTDAIIGMDLLRLSNLTIDFSSGNLVFDLTEPRPYLADGDPMAKCVTVELQVQDHPVRLIVDTGLKGMLLYEDRVLKRLPGLRTSSIVKATMGDRVEVKQATLPDVNFGDRSRDVQVTFLTSPGPGTLPEIDGIVGIDAFHSRRVRFDFSGRTLKWQ